jgi:hypothetical protein
MILRLEKFVREELPISRFIKSALDLLAGMAY